MKRKEQENTMTEFRLENTAKKQNRFLKLTKRIFIGLTLFFLAVLVTGLVYQLAVTGLDKRKYSPPGKMVDVGGHRLHLYCTGEGARTVVLEAGLGGGVLDWSLVQPEIAKTARVCAYDRAGTGWSDAGPEPRDSRQIVNELHTLLQNAGLKPPFVLVGHSIGGVNAQLYASLFPDEVAGLVLVDSSHENQFSRKELPGYSAAYSLLIKLLAPVGVGRIIAGLRQPSENISPALANELAAIYSHTGHLFSVADEFSNIPKSMDDLRANPMRLGAKPLIVLTHGKAQDTESAESAWRELQSDLAKRSSSGKQIIAQNSGHYIQFDEPRLVIDAIREALNDGRE
jgi:pimeloyl-ACP methyl ester carboxylesterase